MRAALLLALIVMPGTVLSADWRVHKSKHFTVHYVGSRGFAQQVAQRAERYYRQIARDLGYTRHDNFWLWDARASIYLYPTRDAFIAARKTPDWAEGLANHDGREIASYAGSHAFLGTVLPHEMTHLIFRDFIGFNGNAPLWLDEGIAQWQEDGARDRTHRLTRALILSRGALPLGALTALDVRTVENGNLARVFYAQSASVVGFLIERHGRKAFGKLCRQLRDGKPLKEALSFTYPRKIVSIESLEKEWVSYLRSGDWSK